MKFLGSSIPSVNFNVVLGNSIGEFQYNDTLKKLIKVDNSIEYVDFGARKEIKSKMKLAQISETNYHAIKDYLLNNSGEKIQIDMVASEEIFGPLLPASGTSFYSYLLDVNLLGEQNFSSTNGLYEIDISLSYSGQNSGDELNSSALYDFLIEVEPNAIGVTQQVSLIADLAGISAPSEGDSTYVLEDKRVYFYQGAWTIIDKSISVRQKITNDLSLGLTNAVFRWSSFATTSLDEAFYNKFVDENATIGYGASFAVLHTGDASTARRQGVAVKQSTGTMLISGSSTAYSSDTYALRFEVGSTVPDATVLAIDADGTTIRGEAIIYDDFTDRWFILAAQSTSRSEVYYSDDDGATWTKSLTSLTDEAMNIVRTVENNLTVIARTGTPNIDQNVCWVSTNNGVTWKRQSTFNNDSAVTSTRHNIALSSTDGALLTVNPRGGCYRSDDKGATWTLVTIDTGDVSHTLTKCEVMIENFEDGVQVFYLGGKIITGAYGVILRSIDQGVTWTEVKRASFTSSFDDLIIDADGSVYGFLEYYSGAYYASVWRSSSGTGNFLQVGSSQINRRVDQSILNNTSGLIYSSFSDSSTGLPVFETITIDHEENVTNQFLSGMINRRSIKFPTSNIALNKGPNIETPQGFKFSIDNVDRLHITLKKYNFFGAKVRFYIYDNSAGQERKILIRSGVNKNSSIGYMNYEFDVEPEYFYSKDFVIPDKVLEKSSLDSVSDVVVEDLKDKNIPLSFGRWKYAKMQPIAFLNKPEIFSIEVVPNNSEVAVSWSSVVIVEDVVNSITGAVYGAGQTGTTLIADGFSIEPEVDDVFTIAGDSTEYAVVSATFSVPGRYNLVIAPELDTSPANDAVMTWFNGSQKIIVRVTPYSNDDLLKNISSVFLNVVFSSASASGSVSIDRYTVSQDFSTRINFFTEDGISVSNLTKFDRIELISRSIKYCIDENLCLGFLQQQANPVVYTYNTDENTYDKYPDGFFKNITGYTDIEKTTQIEASIENFNNGLSSLADKAIILYESQTDDLFQTISDQVIEGEIEAITLTNYNKLNTNFISLPSLSGNFTYLHRLNAGATDGGEATSWKGEKVYRGQFGPNATVSNEFRYTNRWFSRNTSFNNNSYSFKQSGIFKGGLNLAYYNYPVSATATKGTVDQLINEGSAFVRYFDVDSITREKLKGSDSVKLIFSQMIQNAIKFRTIPNPTLTSYVTGVYLVVQAVKADSTKYTAFEGQFSAAINDLSYDDSDDGAGLHTTGAVVFNNKPEFLGGKVQSDFTSSSGTVAGSGVNTIFIGNDLVVLDSALFDSGAYLFGDCVGLQVSFIMLGDYPSYTAPFERAEFSAGEINRRQDEARSDTDTESFYLSYGKSFDVENDEFFVKLDGGQTKDNEILEKPSQIGQAVFDNHLKQSVSFTNFGSRDTWKLRKQFFENETVSNFLKDFANNSFSVGAIGNDGVLNFKSLSISDYSDPIITIDDTMILKDSVSKIKFRQSTEIFNKFIFNYNWDWGLNTNTKKVVIEVDEQGAMSVEGLSTRSKNGIISKFSDALELSRRYFGTGQTVTKTFDLPYFYNESIPKSTGRTPEGSLKDLIEKSLEYFIFNAWDFSFKIPMKYVIYDTNVLNSNNRIEIGDFINLNSYFFSNNRDVKGFVKGIKPNFYSGQATISMYATAPPEVTDVFYDYIWNAGEGDISGDKDDYKIKVQDLWPFKDATQIGTYPDAGTGDISSNKSDYKFTDDTYADADDEYNPFDY